MSGALEAGGRVPVKLVTGFLGAGKTTLLNHLLEVVDADRFAVIENEFGDLGIDSELFGASASAVFALNEGCVCCTVREDLVALFEELAGRVEDFDHVLIETSGLADPGPVMRVFERAGIRAAFRLDGVITVVDAHQVEADLEDSETCAEQIAYADLLVLNKTEGMDGSTLASIEARLASLNPLARMVRAVHARVPVQQILQLGAGELKGEAVRAGPPASDAAHRHDDSIASVAVEADGDMNVAQLDRWLGTLVRRHDLQLLRMKGVLSVPGQPRRLVFHGVRDVVDVEPGPSWADAPRRNRAVFIGRGLDPGMLKRGFAACVQPTGASGRRAATS